MQVSNILGFDFSHLILLLTPVERWQAARRFQTNFMTERWFILIAVAALIILTALLFWVSYKRIVEERKIAEQLFIDYGERIGLSARERQILLEVVSRSGLKRSDAIFTMEEAFDRGATRLIEKNLIAGQGRRRWVENEQLRADLSFLREKLGFLSHSLIGLPAKSRRLSSRQIPVGRKLHITPYKTRRSANIESTVIRNDDMELTLKLKRPVKSTPGDHWRARFCFSASVWEFDSSVVRCDSDVLVLNHTDNIRFINLRRFLRVPVKKPAFVASFPFTRMVAPNNGSGEVAPNVEQDSASSCKSSWAPPEFVPAVLTELAGLSLCLDVPLEVKVGERVLVIFRLDEEEDRNSSSQKAGKVTASKIIQDIGEVRHTKPIKNGLSIAIELVGLSDSDINELVCATNAASLRVRKKRTTKQDISRALPKHKGMRLSPPMSDHDEQGAAEPAAAQGA